MNWLDAVFVAFLVLNAAWSGYLFWRQTALSKRVDWIDTDVNVMRAEIDAAEAPPANPAEAWRYKCL